ncbi:AMP-binding protein [Kocuria marina]|uniref:AMP-binding protein n=1 Tax=Kocuria marina TaxID=223184 RepID=UPI0022E788D2|nr:AMP-binding protein [Kocuria marina]
MSHPVNINPVRGLLYQARYSPEHPAVIYEDETVDYARFTESVRRLAGAFARSGVGTGDRVAYLGLNSEVFLRTMFAAWWLGAVFEPLNFRLAPREVAGLLTRSTPAVTIVEPGHVPVLEAALPLAEGYDGGSVVVVDTDPAVPWTPDGSQGEEASGDDGAAVPHRCIELVHRARACVGQHDPGAQDIRALASARGHRALRGGHHVPGPRQLGRSLPGVQAVP